jgi:hypothetical protein
MRRSFYATPKSRRWLSYLPPREELIARMALREDVHGAGASRAWEARIADLQADLVKSAADWAELLPAVERARREITKGKT